MSEERTKDRLARDLEQAGAPQPLIDRARAGAYDDYESASATPIRDLVRDLTRAGLHALRDRAITGAYDATRAEADAWFQREGRQLLEDDDEK